MTALIARLMGVLGALAGVAALLLLFVAPELPGHRLFAATSALGLAGWLFLDWPAVGAALTSRGGLEAARALALVALGLGSVGLLVAFAERHPRRWDLTEEGLHSVSARTQKVLATLKGEPITITGYFSSGRDALTVAHRQRWDALLQAFLAAAPGLTGDTVDPDVARRQAEENEIEGNAVVILRSADRIERVLAPDEEALLNAILRVANGRDQRIYLSEGHGERGLDPGTPRSLFTLQRQLAQLGMEMATLDLRREAVVPQDAAALLIVDPTLPLLPTALSAVEEYLRRSGAVFVAAERGRPTGLEAILRDAGLELADAVVLDPLLRAPADDGSTLWSARFGIHPSVRGLRSPVVFPGVTPVVPVPHDESAATTHWLVESSEQARAHGGEAGSRGEQPPPPALDGPFTVVALAELHPDGVGGGVLGLSGDADWLGDGTIDRFGNADLALRLIGHLGRHADLVRLPPRREPTDVLALDFGAQAFAAVTAVILLPGACVLTAVVLWARRRGR